MSTTERTPNHTPRDLAQRIHTKLGRARGVPTAEVLEELLQVAFLASLGTEEGTGIRCTFSYVRPGSPDPDPPERIRTHRWTYAKLERHIPFQVRNVIKFALAADPDATSIAVGSVGGHLVIHGLFDQQEWHRQFLRNEGDGGFLPPGLFQVEVLGLGHIRVTSELAVLGELRHAHLAPEPIDVLNEGPVLKALAGATKSHSDRAVRIVEDTLGQRLPAAERRRVADFTSWRWIQTIQRLLSRTRAHGHGASYLLVDDTRPTHLNVRYSTRYSRIPETLMAAVTCAVLRDFFRERIQEELTAEADELPVDDYLGDATFDGELDDSEKALTDAIAFVAGLSRIDGLVWLTKSLQVLGFGVEARAPDVAISAVVADKAANSTGKRLQLDRFGTRHRAILRFCAAHPGVIGFVASEDGPVRAVLASSKRVTLWENVELVRRFPDETAV